MLTVACEGFDSETYCRRAAGTESRGNADDGYLREAMRSACLATEGAILTMLGVE
jgi:hypothetical protein